jgi:hypothetical protein
VTSHVNTYAAGSYIQWCKLTVGTDNILIVPLQATGIPSDTVMQDCTSLQAVFTAGGVEANFTGYIRPVLGSSAVTVTYNTTANTATATFAPQVWTAAGGAVNNSLVKIVIAYRLSSSTADSGCPVIAVQDYTASTTGGGLTINASALTATAV